MHQKQQMTHPFVAGVRQSMGVPGVILLASAAGFGALARDAGLSAPNAALMMLLFYALPAQVVMVDQLARGGAMLGAALAVSLIGVRLLPMSVVIAPYLGGSTAPLWRRVLGVHAVAITGWIEGMRWLPPKPEPERLPFFLGMGGGFVVFAVLGTLAGFVVAGKLPPLWAAVLLFLTPIYFAISLLATATGVGGHAAILAGAALGPVMFMLVPGFDLLLTGLVGGTIAHLAGRRAGRAAGPGTGDQS